jgi:hypothetical protein
MDCNSLNNARALEKRGGLWGKFGRYLLCTLKKQLLQAELTFEKELRQKQLHPYSICARMDFAILRKSYLVVSFKIA